MNTFANITVTVMTAATETNKEKEVCNDNVIPRSLAFNLDLMGSVQEELLNVKEYKFFTRRRAEKNQLSFSKGKTKVHIHQK